MKKKAKAVAKSPVAKAVSQSRVAPHRGRQGLPSERDVVGSSKGTPAHGCGSQARFGNESLANQVPPSKETNSLTNTFSVLAPTFGLVMAAGKGSGGRPRPLRACLLGLVGGERRHDIPWKLKARRTAAGEEPLPAYPLWC